MKFLVIYSSEDGSLKPQEFELYAKTWSMALFKALEYEKCFIDLKLKKLTKIE